MPSYSYRCQSCEAIFTVRCPYEEIDKPKVCLSCGKIDSKQIWTKMPGLTKASYIDGRKTEANQNLKEAAKLEVEKAGMRVEDRAGIQKEINKRRSIK